MTSSPTKHIPHMPPPNSAATPHQLGSPRSTPRLRKLQSAHALSSNYTAIHGPSLISQQRQQQRNVSTSQNLSSSQTSQTPMPQNVPLSLAHAHNRARSNSDLLGSLNALATPRRNPPAKKTPTFLPPTNAREIESIVRQGPQGELLSKLDRLRHLILVDGLESDSDGMVRFFLGAGRLSQVFLTAA